jgi:hypothetical protein
MKWMLVVIIVLLGYLYLSPLIEVVVSDFKKGRE